MKLDSTSICLLRHGNYPGDPRVEKELSALVEAGYRVDLLCLRGRAERFREVIEGITVYRMPHSHKRGSALRYLLEYGLSFVTMFMAVTVLILKKRYACIQVNTMPDTLVFATAIPKLLGAKVLLDMHEPMPELWETITGKGKNSRVVRLLAKIEQMAIGYANRTITVNKACKVRFVERGANSKHISVIRNVPPEGLRPIVRECSSDELVLMIHGTIEKRYGHETLIRAVQLIRNEIQNACVWIIGDGENVGYLKQLTYKLNCSDIVHFKGYVPFNQIGAMISRATIGVVPLTCTPWGELAQPNKLFEYVLCRKPVIVSRLQAIQETFNDDCVMFVKPNDFQDLANAVINLWRDKARCQRLVENAFKLYEQHRWVNEKNKYLAQVDFLCRDVEQ